MLVLCAFLPSPVLSQTLLAISQEGVLSESGEERYHLTHFQQPQDFLGYIEREKRHIDCLILEEGELLPVLLYQLHQLTILLPTVILESPCPPESPRRQPPARPSDNKQYHNAVLRLPTSEIPHLDRYIEEAIAKFLRLSTQDPPASDSSSSSIANLAVLSSLSQQQRRLAEKLKERLEYMGVYYKRSPANFLRHMTPPERQDMMQRLKEDYRSIILSYFSAKPDESDRVNQSIDTFVNLAFFSDISVSQIVEIHIELMDEFSKQLKLEGRSDDILQDYRLTLIDIIAHLCEMYRRSIPRES